MDGKTYNRLEEGERLACYDDATGEVLKAGDIPQGTPTISVGVTGPDVIPGLVITQAQSDAMYAERWALAESDAAFCIGQNVFSALDPVRRAAVTSQVYNLGRSRFSKFIDQIAAIQASDWTEAAKQCLDSRAARELPARYGRLAKMYETGKWQPGYGG